VAGVVHCSMIKLNDAVWTPAGRFGEVVEFSKSGKRAKIRYIGQVEYLSDWIYVSTLKKWLDLYGD